MIHVSAVNLGNDITCLLHDLSPNCLSVQFTCTPSTNYETGNRTLHIALCMQISYIDNYPYIQGHCGLDLTYIKQANSWNPQKEQCLTPDKTKPPTPISAPRYTVNNKHKKPDQT